jgi:hypothetical protein
MRHEVKEGQVAKKRAPWVVTAVLLGVASAPVAAGTGWAEQPLSPAAPLDRPDDSPALTAMAAVAGAIGSFFYIPFKAGAICPGMALASGASLAARRGDRGTAEYLLRVGCTGTYLITPGMVRGQEEFQGSGAR